MLVLHPGIIAGDIIKVQTPQLTSFSICWLFCKEDNGLSEIFCLAGWLAKAFSKVLNPISLFYAVPNINVNVTWMTTPTFYLKRCLHKDNGKH